MARASLQSRHRRGVGGIASTVIVELLLSLIVGRPVFVEIALGVAALVAAWAWAPDISEFFFGLRARPQDKRRTMIALLVMAAGVALFSIGAIWHALERPVQKEAAQPFDADQLAAAFAEKTRVRELFNRELDQPVTSMFVIITLTRPLPEDDMANVAALVEVCGQADDQPCLYFGLRSDSMAWNFPGQPKAGIPGLRSIIWTFPRLSNKDTTATTIDSLFVYRFDYLDRLEAGAIMTTPFKTLRDLNHGRILIKATRRLSENIAKVSIVANDFVVSDLSTKEISGWAPPSPRISGQVTLSQVDEKTGAIIPHSVTQTEIVDMNTFNLVEEMKSFPMFTAHISAARVVSSPMPMWATLDFADMDVRALRASTAGLGPRNAGIASMTINPGDHGWLPVDRPPTRD